MINQNWVSFFMCTYYQKSGKMINLMLIFKISNCPKLLGFPRNIVLKHIVFKMRCHYLQVIIFSYFYLRSTF